MSRVSLLNAGAVVGAIGLAILIGQPGAPTAARAPRAPLGPPSAYESWARSVRLPDGRAALADTAGAFVAVRDFRRIVSASFVADRLLVELAEPDRVVALTAYGAEHSRQPFRYSGKTLVQGLDAIEEIVGLRPDLVLVNNFGDSGRVARLREAGIEVFDLGEMRGLGTLLPQIDAVATLLGHPDRGRRLAVGVERRLRAVAASVHAASRKSAIYLGVAGTQLYGGTMGTGYHDVLTYAGLRDAAAARFLGWPHYRVEEVLALDPEVIVTTGGGAALVCRHPGLAGLGACRRKGTIVELPADLLSDPGLAMLDAAEELRAAVYGEPPAAE